MKTRQGEENYSPIKYWIECERMCETEVKMKGTEKYKREKEEERKKRQDTRAKKRTRERLHAAFDSR